MKVLVTGGAGFIGSNFSNINKHNYDITVLDNLYLGDRDNLDSDIKFVKGDASNIKDLEKTGTDFDIVIALAGTSSAPMFLGNGFISGYMNSIQSFLQTLEFSRKIGVKKFLYASTSSLYGNKTESLQETNIPVMTNHYSVTKFCYEAISKCYHQLYPEMEIIGFRFMSVYGTNEEAKGAYANIISQFIWDFARNLPPIIYGDGTQYRDFTNVLDIVQGITKAINTTQLLKNNIFNIGTGESASLNEIIIMIQKHLGQNISPIYIPNPVKEGYIQGQLADISKIKEILKYKPQIKLIDGITSQIKNLSLEKIRHTSSDLLRNKKND